MKIFSILLALTVAATAYATEYHVAPAGNDENAGTRDKPFKTISAAARTSQSGDVVTIHAGTYRETVTLKGKAKNNIIFQSLPGEVVVISGADPVEGDWRKYKNSIYEIDLDKPVSQVFVDGLPMTYARWPNAIFRDRWNPSFWKNNRSGHGVVNDPDLATSGIDWTGAILTLNTNPTWNKYTAIVLQHAQGSATLRYEHDKLWSMSGGHYGYYLSGLLDALDGPEEWFYDRKQKKFYQYFPEKVEPQGHAVEVKVRNYGFMVEQCDQVTLKGLQFFASTFYFRECNYATVDGCHVRFPNVAYLLTELDRDSKPTVSTTMIGHHNTVRNSSIAYSPTHGLRMLGSYSLVENNLIYDCNQIGSLAYAPLWLGNLEDNVTWEGALKYEGKLKETISGSVVGSTQRMQKQTGDDPDRAKPAGHCVVRNNTLCKSGNIILAFYEQPHYTIAYNHVYDGGLFVHDVSLIYTTLPQIHGSEIAYNWVHGCFNIAIRGDDQSRGITYHHNVLRDAKRSIVVKGDDNAVYNNTALTSAPRPQGGVLNVQTWPEPNKPWYRKLWPRLPEQNTKTPVVNNLATGIITTPGKPYPKDDPRLAYNWLTNNTESLLQDPAHHDYRPKADSPLVDAGKIIPGITDGYVGKAPDIGAYESGGPLWKPGHQNSIWVSEPDNSGSFRVALSMPPIGEVIVSIAVENGTVPPTQIGFNEKNWMIPQRVTPSAKGLYRITAKGEEIKEFAVRSVQVN